MPIPVGLDCEPVSAQQEQGASHLLDILSRVRVQNIAHLQS